MSVFYQIGSRTQSSVDFYGEGRYVEAALEVEAAIELAERHELNDELPRLLTMVAYAWDSADEPRKALNALLRIRDLQPGGIDAELESKIQKQSFHLMYQENPNIEGLQQRIHELERLSRSNGDAFRGMVCGLRNSLCSGRGMWAAALIEKEIQWANRETDSLCEVCAMSGLVTDSLDAGDADKATDWLNKLRQENPTRVGCQSNMSDAECRYALFNDLAQEAERAADAYDQIVRGTSSFRDRVSSVEFRVRASLLNACLGDPAARLHPAFRLAAQRFDWQPPNEWKFKRALLVTDFRLACLRYAAGFAPIDDLYYQLGHETRVGSPVLPIHELDNRAARVRHALDRTRPIAAALDDAFKCSWRMGKIQNRKERLQALLAPTRPNSLV